MPLARARNLAVLTAGILLAVSMIVSPAHAGTRVNNFASGEATAGMAVATGTVTGASGTAMPDTIVDLYAWPSDAVLKAMKPGQTVPTSLLGTATTNSAGNTCCAPPQRA